MHRFSGDTEKDRLLARAIQLRQDAIREALISGAQAIRRSARRVRHGLHLRADISKPRADRPSLAASAQLHACSERN